LKAFERNRLDQSQNEWHGTFKKTYKPSFLERSIRVVRLIDFPTTLRKRLF
jgi:hypothetical protein